MIPAPMIGTGGLPDWFRPACAGWSLAHHGPPGEGGRASQKPMPDDSKGAAQSCGAYQRGKQRHCLPFQAGNLASSRRTCVARQCPLPAGVGTPRSSNAAAMPVRLVMPAACSSAMMGARSAAARLARALRASRLARLKNAPLGFDMRVLPSFGADTIARCLAALELEGLSLGEI
jgi:hypothetical protein